MVEPIDVIKAAHKHVSRAGSAALRGVGAVSSANRITVPGVSQDNIIFAALLFAFIVWITSKGELPTYIAFFKPGASVGPLNTTKDTVVATPSITASPSTGLTPAQAAANQAAATVVGQAGAAAGAATGASNLGNTILSPFRSFLTSPGATTSITSIPSVVWQWFMTGQLPSFSNK